MLRRKKFSLVIFLVIYFSFLLPFIPFTAFAAQEKNQSNISLPDDVPKPSLPVDPKIIKLPQKPSPPTLNPVTTPTNLTSQMISGTKDAGASVILNSKEIVRINSSKTWEHNLSLSNEGDNPITIFSKNRWGKESNTISANIFRDTTQPQGTISINNTDNYTAQTTVVLNLEAQDPEPSSGILKMSVSNNSSDWSDYPYSSTRNWSLSAGDGMKAVYAVFCDSAGNCSNPAWDYIILDTTPPQISYLSPSPDSVIEEDKPQIKANFTDSSGMNLSLISLSLNGQDITSSSVITQDSISYTPASALAEGDYTVELKLYDTLGNSVTKTWQFSIYKGKLITPEEGGEVVSSDGAAQVVVPPGALSEATQIKVIPVNLDELLSEKALSSLEDRTIYIAVDCQPNGLEFNQDVDLMLTLQFQEVPGTKVELALYDGSQFVPTGQFSTISKDGNTVQFKLSHFSIYGALSNLTTQGAPIGAGVDIPLPDMFTGAFSHAVGITVPPGRKGIQPNLKLQYKSSNPNSWVGYGWALEPGFIMRSTKNGAPTYDDSQDTFIFISDASGTELTHLTDNLYQAKIESGFTKFYKEENDSWKLIQKDGTILELGTSSESKEQSEDGKTFVWHISKVKDTNSNYVEFYYTKDKGKAYLSQIKYTGNENRMESPKHTVEFLLEDRTDTSSSYISGFEITTAKRLHQIQAWINGEADPVWRYELGYEYSPDTDRSLLKSVTQYASDGKALPVQTFRYQRKE